MTVHSANSKAAQHITNKTTNTMCNVFQYSFATSVVNLFYSYMRPLFIKQYKLAPA